MTYRLEVTVPGLLPMENRRRSAHWSVEAKIRRQWRQAVVACTQRAKRPPEPLKRARVQLVRVAPGKAPDPDNLVRAFKPVLDALQPAAMRRGRHHIGCGVIADDTREVVGEVTYRPERCHRRSQASIRIVVEEIP